MTRRPILLAILLAACGSPKDPFGWDKTADAGKIQVVGVHPEAFSCTAFISPQDISARLANGAKVEFTASDLPVPQGTPKPCGYSAEVTGAGPDGGTKFMSWQYTIDCRPAAADDLEQLWKTKETEPDTKPAAVGKRGIDHSRFQLAFFDEDSQCSVWLIGPDAGSRLALGTLIADRLNRENKPHHIRGERVKP